MTVLLLAVGAFALRPLAVGALGFAGEAGVRWLLPLAAVDGHGGVSPPAGESSEAELPVAEAVGGSVRAEPDAVRIPSEYPEWVLVGTATGLSYSEGTRAVGDHDAPGAFTQVYLEPTAYRHFRQRGEFPEGTTLVLEIRRPTSGVSIARGGWFAGRLQGVHAAVKGEAYDGGWAYFDVAEDGGTRQLAAGSCASCHAQHGETDNVFTQFYPRLQAPDG